MKIYLSAAAFQLTLGLTLASEARADIGVPVTVPTGETQPQVKPPESAPVKPVPRDEIQKNRAESAPNVQSSTCRAENGSKLSDKLASASCTDSSNNNAKSPTKVPPQNPSAPINPTTETSTLGGR